MIGLFDLMRWYVTLGPIGYMTASGTMATLVTVPLACWLMGLSAVWYIIVVIALGIVSSYCVHRVHTEFFHHDDPSEIVIDEFIGCLLTFWFVPCTTRAIVFGILLFRFFDISKVVGIQRVERNHGATGIMMDDILAGIYSNIILHILNWNGLL